jgi:hypothetical protein
MRAIPVVGVLVVLAASVVAADTAGLSQEMWERVRAAEPPIVELAPTPSPEAPASLRLKECIALAFRHNSGFRQDQERLVNARGERA